MKKQAVKLVSGREQERATFSPDLLTRIHDVTPAEVKALPTFQYYSDEQVVQLISTIKTFTQIGYSMFYEKQQEEEAKVFNLSDNSPKQNVA